MKKSRSAALTLVALSISLLSACASHKMNAEVDARLTMNEDAVRAVAIQADEAYALALESKSEAALARSEAALARIGAEKATEKAFRMLQHASMK